MDGSRFSLPPQMMLLGVLVVNGGVYLFWRLLRLLAPGLPGRAFLGLYAVLMPLGFLVWFSWRDLSLWVALVMAMHGLVIIGRTAGGRPSRNPAAILAIAVAAAVVVTVGLLTLGAARPRSLVLELEGDLGGPLHGHYEVGGRRHELDERSRWPLFGSDRHWANGNGEERERMQIYYLEIVTGEVDAVCAAYAAAHGVRFGEPDGRLGGARTAPLASGGLVGVRGPLRETEEPVVRPYWLVEDIEAAVAAAQEAGAQLAHPPLEIPGHGTFAITIQGGIQHGLWQR